MFLVYKFDQLHQLENFAFVKAWNRSEEVGTHRHGALDCVCSHIGAWWGPPTSTFWDHCFRYACMPRYFDSRGAAPTTLPHWLSGKVAWWGLLLESQNAEACIHVDTGFLLAILHIRSFAKTSKNANNVESKRIFKISRLVSNYFYKVSKKWRCYRFICIQMYIFNNNINKIK